MVISTEVSPVRLAPLVELCHRRWSLPILAALAVSGGAKVVTLSNRLGASRAVVRATLEDLTEQDLVMANPGYGHPMRPETLLSPLGESAARPAVELLRALERREVVEAGLRKWSLPALAAVGAGAGAERFGEIRGLLAPVTARALAMALRDLEEAGLIERTLLDESPPRAVYSATRAGSSALGPLGRLLAALNSV